MSFSLDLKEHPQVRLTRCTCWAMFISPYNSQGAIQLLFPSMKLTKYIIVLAYQIQLLFSGGLEIQEKANWESLHLGMMLGVEEGQG